MAEKRLESRALGAPRETSMAVSACRAGGPWRSHLAHLARGRVVYEASTGLNVGASPF